MVFVYRLGINWGDKKGICAKFSCTSPVTSLIWPLSLSDESLYFGAFDGQVSFLAWLPNSQDACRMHADSTVLRPAFEPKLN